MEKVLSEVRINGVDLNEFNPKIILGEEFTIDSTLSLKSMKERLAEKGIEIDFLDKKLVIGISVTIEFEGRYFLCDKDISREITHKERVFDFVETNAVGFYNSVYYSQKLDKLMIEHFELQNKFKEIKRVLED